MYKNDSKLVGIFSSGKSGSTLAIRLLDKYTNCFVYPEEISFLSVFADNLVNMRAISNKVWSNKGYIKTPDLNSKLYKSKSFYKYYNYSIDRIQNDIIDFNKLKLDKFNKLFFEKFDGTYEEFINEYLDRVSNWLLNKKYNLNVFKSLETSYLNSYSKIHNMKFIHLIRNPFDVYASLVRSTRFKSNPSIFHSFYLGEDNMTNIIRRWKNHTEYLNKNNLDPKLHIVVKYEDLIQNTSKELDKLINFLNLQKNNTMDDKDLSLLKNKKLLFSAHTASTNVGTEVLNKVIKDPKKTFNYQRNLITDNENLLINLLCKNGIMKFNYEPLEDHGRLKVFFKWILPMSWEFKHLDNGPFIRRPHLMKYRFFLPNYYINFLRSIYYYFYRRIKLIFFGI